MNKRNVNPEEGLLQHLGWGPGMVGACASPQSRGQVAGWVGVGRGEHRLRQETALTLQCQMPRKVAETRLKFFRLFLLLLGLEFPCLVSQKSKEPPPGGPESDAPRPEGWTLTATAEGPLQVSCAAGQCMCVHAGVLMCMRVSAQG